MAFYLLDYEIFCVQSWHIGPRKPSVQKGNVISSEKHECAQVISWQSHKKIMILFEDKRKCWHWVERWEKAHGVFKREEDYPLESINVICQRDSGYFEVRLYEILIQSKCTTYSRQQSACPQFGEERSPGRKAKQCTAVDRGGKKAYLATQQRPTWLKNIYARAIHETCRTYDKWKARGHSEFRSGTKPLEDPNRIPVWVARVTWAGTFNHGSSVYRDKTGKTMNACWVHFSTVTKERKFRECLGWGAFLWAIAFQF